MNAVHLVIALALVEYLVFGWAVGRARGTYGVAAPATGGHEMFERYYRVQMNTLEQLLVFLPALVLFAHYVHAGLAALLGAVFILGRWLYFRGYVADPKKRELGFLIGAIPNTILLLGGLIGAARALWLQGL